MLGRMNTANRPTVLIDLALQGGGSHGAFTWGVLDRLLDEPWLKLSGVSGTSAGAMNAVVLADGLMADGRTGAQTALRRFWQAVGRLGDTLTPPAWLSAWLGPWTPAGLSTTLSPYQSNPLNIDPLRQVLLDTVDFERVRRCHKTQLYIAATDVATGELQLFDRRQLTIDHALASACLPQLFQAVQINGRSYWDGGYAGNPSLMPLITETPADDLLLVQINPSRRDTTPTRAVDIQDRANEITFNASLLKELRSLAWMRRLMDEERARGGCSAMSTGFERVARLRLHHIDATADLAPLGASTKLRTHSAFLQQLHALGRSATERWLHSHAAALGVRGSAEWPAV
jgi:NTE family protein